MYLCRGREELNVLYRHIKCESSIILLFMKIQRLISQKVYFKKVTVIPYIYSTSFKPQLLKYYIYFTVLSQCITKRDESSTQTKWNISNASQVSDSTVGADKENIAIHLRVVLTWLMNMSMDKLFISTEVREVSWQKTTTCHDLYNGRAVGQFYVDPRHGDSYISTTVSKLVQFHLHLLHR